MSVSPKAAATKTIRTKIIPKAIKVPNIDANIEALNAAWQSASEDIAKAGQDANAATNTGDQTSNTNDDNNVTDAEFEEVK